MKRMLVIGLMLAAAAAGLLGVTSRTQAQGASVSVDDIFYAPASVTIGVGDTVTWTWAGSLPHTVTANDGSFASAQQTSGTFAHTFNTAGTFGYVCQVHGTAMTGTVVVQAAAGGGQTPAAGASPTTAAGGGQTPAAGASPTTAAGASPVAAPATGTGGGPGGGGVNLALMAAMIGAAGIVLGGAAFAVRRR
jgi:plastocyanin